MSRAACICIPQYSVRSFLCVIKADQKIFQSGICVTNYEPESNSMRGVWTDNGYTVGEESRFADTARGQLYFVLELR